MAGEVSKKRGEFGEEIVERLLNLIGWTPLLKGRNFECINPFEHMTTQTARITHGIDFIYQYDCPLFNDRQEFVLVSSKYNDEYPSNPAGKFRSHFRELAYALECFKKSDLKNRLSIFQKDPNYTGVIFWIDNGKQGDYDDVIERLVEFRIDDDLDFDSIYLVDNRRADFLYRTITSAKDSFKEAAVLEFLIPNTGLNNLVNIRRTSSPILPVQFINSSILPLKIIYSHPATKSQFTEVLVLNVIDEFEEDCLRGLISLAQNLTEGWANQVYILFPEFNKDRYSETVENVKLSFKDQIFVHKIEVDTFNRNFRNV